MSKLKPFTTMGDLSKRFLAARRRHHNKEVALEGMIEEWQRKLGEHLKKRPYWVDRVVRPIAAAVASKMHWNYEVSGPFGIGATVSVAFFVGEQSPSPFDHNDWQERERGLLLFACGDCIRTGKLLLVDYTRDTGQYRRGTVGEVNGFNNPRIEIPDDADVDWFIDKIQVAEQLQAS